MYVHELFWETRPDIIVSITSMYSITSISQFPAINERVYDVPRDVYKKYILKFYMTYGEPATEKESLERHFASRNNNASLREAARYASEQLYLETQVFPPSPIT